MLHTTAKFTGIEEKLFTFLSSTQENIINTSLHKSILEHRSTWRIHENIFEKVLTHKNTLALTHHFFKNWTTLSAPDELFIQALSAISDSFAESSTEEQALLIEAQQYLLNLMHIRTTIYASHRIVVSPFTQMINQLCRGEDWQSPHLLFEETLEWHDDLCAAATHDKNIVDSVLFIALLELIRCSEVDIVSSMLESALEKSFLLNDNARDNCSAWFSLHRSRDAYSGAALALNTLEKLLQYQGKSFDETKIQSTFAEIIQKRSKVFLQLALYFDIPQERSLTQQNLHSYTC